MMDLFTRLIIGFAVEPAHIDGASVVSPAESGQAVMLNRDY